MEKIGRIVLDILKHGGVGIVLLLVLYFISGFDTGDVMGNSMNPYFKNRDGYSRIKRGVIYNRCDAITFDGSKYDSSVDSADFIKRIIGLPNEKISIANSKFYINDRLINEAGFIDDSVRETDNLTLTLKENEYFVLGDNRLHSYDSRYFGSVNKKDLSRVISKQGKSECLSAYELSGIASTNNTKSILIVSMILLTTLIGIIFISLYNPELIKRIFKLKYIATLLKIFISTAILWFFILLALIALVGLLWFLKLTPAQTNLGNVNEMVEERETEFKKFDK